MKFSDFEQAIQHLLKVAAYEFKMVKLEKKEKKTHHIKPK